MAIHGNSGAGGQVDSCKVIDKLLHNYLLGHDSLIASTTRAFIHACFLSLVSCYRRSWS
jgi:hypothetical protein